MAYAVARSTLSDEIATKIHSMLCLQPDVPVTRHNNGNIPPPIKFYVLVEGILHLPYLFAASLFQIVPNIDIKYPISGVAFTGQLREHQIPVENEAWGQLESKGTSTLGLYPGFGKTILGASLAARAKLITCVLVHREILTGQWKKTFESFTNARVWIVGEKDPPPTCEVIICMDTRWHLIPTAVRDCVGFLIIDEAHAFCTPGHVGCLLTFHPKYIVIESATLERDDGMHSMIYAMAGNHGVFRETDIPFTVMKITTNTKPPRAMTRTGGINWPALVHATLFDERRNAIIMNLVIQNPTSTILILTSLVEHTMLLYNMLQRMGVSSDYMCGSRKTYHDCRVLIGTMPKIGTGFDPATSCPDYAGRPFDTLILAASIKKYSILVQNVGRAFRSKWPCIMHLVDNDSIFINHWYKCRKWYLARGGVISNHNIENSQQPTPASENITNVQQKWLGAVQLRVIKQ
jgi:hypothetical protein